VFSYKLKILVRVKFIIPIHFFLDSFLLFARMISFFGWAWYQLLHLYVWTVGYVAQCNRLDGHIRGEQPNEGCKCSMKGFSSPYALSALDNAAPLRPGQFHLRFTQGIAPTHAACGRPLIGCDRRLKSILAQGMATSGSFVYDNLVKCSILASTSKYTICGNNKRMYSNQKKCCADNRTDLHVRRGLRHLAPLYAHPLRCILACLGCG
jgi:hypothetical protein